ncbi:MAG TPA: metallophosphoesterase [Gemmatimonadaceae bacterium]
MRTERRAGSRWRAWWPTSLSRLVGLHGRLHVRHERVRVPGWRGAPLRIAFASDFHAGPTTHPKHLAEACDAIAATTPDILLLGGDFVQEEAVDIGDLAFRLGAIPAPLGKLAVLGNHDFTSGGEGVARRLRLAGIDVLQNAAVRLPLPEVDAWVCGLDDFDEGHPDAVRALDGTTGVRIVLMHSPETLHELEGHRFDLAFCGHTHGGQVALPGGTPLMMPGGWLNRRFAHGRHDLNDGGTLFVSRGIGFSRWPVRLFARPEIHLVEVGA